MQQQIRERSNLRYRELMYRTLDEANNQNLDRNLLRIFWRLRARFFEGKGMSLIIIQKLLIHM